MLSYIFIWSILSSGLFIIFAKYNIRPNIFLKMLGMYKILSLTEELTQWCSVKTGLFKNIAKVMGKHLCWNFFLIKLQASTKMEIFAKIVQSKILNGKLNFLISECFENLSKIFRAAIWYNKNNIKSSLLRRTISG